MAKQEKYDFDAFDYTRNLLIVGPVGVGKTYKANELLGRYKGKNQDNDTLAKYRITDSAFKEHIASGTLKLIPPELSNVNPKKYPLEMMTRCEVLLFDDLGVADGSDAYIRKLTFVLDTRMERGLTTIFTTNLSSTDLEAKLNERLTSRILYNADVVVMTGKDRRAETTRTFRS